jgi:cell division protein FtsI (penicillin-binding protein 3)
MKVDTSQLVRIQDKKKLIVIAFFVFFLFSFLILQFFKIQILEADKWLHKARSQHQFTVSEPFKRGIFYSNGYLSAIHDDRPQPLVVDLPMFHLYIDPDSVTGHAKETMVEHLAPIMEWNQQECQHAQGEFYKKSRSRRLAMWLSHEKKEQIEQWWCSFAKQEQLPRNALYFVQDYKRCYPYGKLLGQVLQTIREDKDTSTHQAIPTGGLEYYFDRLLQGKEGKRRLLRSPKFPLDRGDVLESPCNGHDIYLTIHPYIQAVAEEEIAQAVLAAHAKSGWITVMDVRTGDILAIAQYPFFYPAEYRKFYSDPNLLEHTKVKAITDCFEPGSTAKALSIALALKANKERIAQGKSPLFDPEAKVDLKKIHLPGRKIPMKDITTAQFVNMNIAMQKSSNIYAADVIQKVVDAFGEKWYRQQLQDVFGFGCKTGIELPSETAGFVPSPGKCYANGKLQWSVPTPGCLAIGYNFLVNTVQMLRAYSVIANGGYLVQPSLIKKIVNQDHEVVYERTVSREQVLDCDITDRIIEGMKYVTKPGGSASRAEVPGFTEAGKTGTSEKIQKGVYAKNVHVSTFIGFAPAKNAKIVALIAIDEPEFRKIPGVGSLHLGGRCAAPVFGGLAKRILDYLGEPPDDPYGYPKGDPRHDPTKADMTQEVKALKDLFSRWHKR